MESFNIRSKFINYFTKNGHEHVKSSSLIPHNDPSLMFVNSGMVQFKNVFTGLETRKHKKATSYQKCMRAGGKHNDLESVGFTSRHHTFFEMLGNFSFGDYFKEEAIYYAWELLTKEYGLPKNKLYITVYHTDDEAYNIWQKITNFSDDRIIRITTQDNFWSMGDTGPCGPCSEIFYDHGDKIPGGLPGTKDQDGDRYVEIWNMVFMEFEQIDADNRINLSAKSIDTGMGLERMTAIMQGKHDNYDIDIFHQLIQFIEHYTNTKCNKENKFIFKIIADHIRAISFLIADGILPSNEGRGYVLRRILRRAVRYINHLGIKEPTIYLIIPNFISTMENIFPELSQASSLIVNTVRYEETNFLNTLSKGLKLLNEFIDKSNNKVLPGEQAFKLYDTYGFPLDLTKDILKEKGMKVINEDFEKEMKKQKETARKAWVGSGEKISQTIWFDIQDKYGATEFLGYKMYEAQGKVLAIIHNNNSVREISSHTEFYLITNQTPFYGESGGQKGDIGYIKSNNASIRVIDTKKILNIHAHLCILEDGYIKIDETVNLIIDMEYRNNIKIHHSATHILQAALKKVLGSHVNQKGSLVADNKLRFDFTHYQQLSSEEILNVEYEVNEVIFSNKELNTKIIPLDQARKEGATALFGEKYDNEVRVIDIFANDNQIYSSELCGGTHVNRTGDIGMFKITSEGSIASGIRRIEAIAGTFALKYTQKDSDLLQQVSEKLNVNKYDAVNKIVSLQYQNQSLLDQVLKLQIKEVLLTNIEQHVKHLGDFKILYQEVECDLLIAKKLIDQYIKYENLLIILTVLNFGKIGFVVASSDARVHAGNLTKYITNLVGGNGGGSLKIGQGEGKQRLPKNIDDLIVKWLSLNKN